MREFAADIEIAKLNRKINMYMNTIMKKYDLSSGTMGFMMELFFKDCVCQKELSLSMNCDKGATARAVAQLENKGYVKRIPDETYKKQKIVIVTAKGRAIQNDMSNDLRFINSVLFEGVSVGEKKSFFKTLQKLNRNIIKKLDQD